MTLAPRQLIRNMWHLGSGEMLARLCSIAVVMFLGHRYGVVTLGIYALAMTLSYYSQPVIDFGLKHVGARLLAQYPQSGEEIVDRVQRRRLLMAGAVLPLILVYAAIAKLPADMKVFLFVFSASSCLYALSLDWAAWGKEQLRFFGLSKAVVPFTILMVLVLGRPQRTEVLWWAAAASVAGYVLQGMIFWLWWKRVRPPGTADLGNRDVISESLAWRRTSIMGVAWLGNLAFNTIDMLMIGVMSNPEQVGFYSAAYRVLSQVLITYYLLTQSLYPQLSRQNAEQRRRMLRPGILLSLLGAGVVLAVAVTLARRPIMTILFGHAFVMAAPLLVLLAWAIPLDFLTSYLSNAYIAWGMEKKILLCTAVAAASNIVLNLIWIPAYGAMAAAVNTLVSYVVFLVSLAVAGRSARELATAAQPRPEMIAPA